MSRTASIEMSYNNNIDFIDFINRLILSNWNFNDYGKIRYMIGEDFEWESDILENFKDVINKMEAEYFKDKIVAINFLYKNNIGGNLIFLNRNKVVLNLNINRKTLTNGVNTDFSFYMEALNNILTIDCYINCIEIP
ncbi:hypothetical protein [Chryseobacterium lathyri]|uniref:Uncharacterized protein n=1 Tax=Chryseobacterium lathyri TaxID=395933 RepID=A0ABT9SNG1_9FLAO|nr:hypothetical protein [Chryseobacterium lathyri]MDP9960384.1 hypothetical protein [Chryseobacterium lathyri]